MSLHTLTVGTTGPRVAFLHGLFGQGRNWNQVAKALTGPDGDHARCLLIDLPDHGRSAWSSDFSYSGYAAAVAETMAQAGAGEKFMLVGHSLGGKVAMLVALTRPDLVDRVAVVDIAPKGYGDLARFEGYIAAMRSLPLAELGSRADADAHLARVEPDAGIRAFLLQNLRREGDGWRWQANLDLIAADAERRTESAIADFPQLDASFPGPALWLTGGESGYVRPGDEDRMRQLFPRVRHVTIKGAGHWVHTDAPDVIRIALRRFLPREGDTDS